jgi:glycosyltransferase involved in cell wall biosynthesis
VGNITTLLAPCRVVLLMDNPSPYSPLNIRWTKKELLRIKLIKYLGLLSAKRADKVRFVSDNSKRILVKELNLPSAKCETIYHGCDINYNGAGNDFYEDVKLKNNYILTVAIPAPYKNLQQLIKAFDVLVKKYNYNGNLVIVGDLFYFNYVKRLRLLVSELNLDERIIFTGKVEHKKIKAFYTHADLFVLPSIAETFGMPITEAMSCGVPVAVSDPHLSILKGNHLIPFREICGDAAHYFNPFDPVDIADGIHKIIADEDYRERLRREGFAQVRKYRWEETAKSMVKIFSEVL